MPEKESHFPHIRELREDADLSQADMAKILNCSQVAYTYYEIGKRDIPTEILINLAKYHNCSVDYLLGLTNRIFVFHIYSLPAKYFIWKLLPRDYLQSTFEVTQRSI